MRREALLLLLCVVWGAAVGAPVFRTRGDTRANVGNAQWVVRVAGGEDVAWGRYMGTGGTRWLDVAVKNGLDAEESFYASGFVEGVLAAEDIQASFGGKAPRVSAAVRALVAKGGANEALAQHVAYARGVVDGVKKARGGSSGVVTVESLLARAEQLLSKPAVVSADDTATVSGECTRVQWANSVLRAHGEETLDVQDIDEGVENVGVAGVPVVGRSVRVIRTLALPGAAATQLAMLTPPGVLAPLTRVVTNNHGMSVVSAKATGLQWLAAVSALRHVESGAQFAGALSAVDDAALQSGWVVVDATLVDRYNMYTDAVWVADASGSAALTHACVANDTMSSPLHVIHELRSFDELQSPPRFYEEDEGAGEGSDAEEAGGIGALLGGLFGGSDDTEAEAEAEAEAVEEEGDEFAEVGEPLTPPQLLRESVYEHIGMFTGLSHTCSLFGAKAIVPASFVHPIKAKCPLVAFDANDSRHHLVASVPGKFFADPKGLSTVAVEVLVRNGWTYTRSMSRAEMVWVHDHDAMPMSAFQPGVMLMNHVGGELLFAEKGLLVESLQELDDAEGTGPENDLRAELIHPRTVLMYDFNKCSAFWDAYKDDEEWVNTTWLYKATDKGAGLGTRVVSYDGLDELANVYLREDSYRCRKAGEYPRGVHPAPFHVLQEYVANPMLWAGRKFEVRTYLMIAQADPLVALFHPGWVRVNAVPFTMDEAEHSNAAVHLSSPTRQRTYWLYDQIAPLLSWPTRALEDVLVANGAPEGTLEDTVLPRMEAIAKRVVDTVRDELMDQTVGLFGVYALDFLIDADSHVWLLEASTNPPMRVHHNPMLNRELEGVVEEAMNIALEMRERFAFGAPSDVLEAVENWRVLINEEPPPGAME